MRCPVPAYLTTLMFLLPALSALSTIKGAISEKNISTTTTFQNTFSLTSGLPVEIVLLPHQHQQWGGAILKLYLLRLISGKQYFHNINIVNTELCCTLALPGDLRGIQKDSPSPRPSSTQFSPQQSKDGHNIIIILLSFYHH